MLYTGNDVCTKSYGSVSIKSGDNTSERSSGWYRLGSRAPRKTRYGKSEKENKRRHRSCKVCALYKVNPQKFTKDYCPVFYLEQTY
ncbi:hypothetical protein PHMEG_00015726 [Phytophthora megakarya]|uniref:Uncharacterized protein n=1 Tax=Phytophthora megakarya TaxID=4795 RepID=A0A225W0Q2_9STRA|nr:hypothetical protein PHMEG_00015726 [Phytophthora megakarya]